MPAARPDHDAFAVWIAVVAEFGEERGVRDGAFKAIHERTKPFALLRGEGRIFDRQEGLLIGETLSRDHLKKLFEKALRLMKDDPALAAQMHASAALISARLKSVPGSIFSRIEPDRRKISVRGSSPNTVPPRNSFSFTAAVSAESASRFLTTTNRRPRI
jgi:hypothetical protein